MKTTEPRIILTDLSPEDRAALEDAVRGEWEYIMDLLGELLKEFQATHDTSPLRMGELLTWFRRHSSGTWAKCQLCGEISRPVAEEVRDWGIAPEWVCWRCLFDNTAVGLRKGRKPRHNAPEVPRTGVYGVWWEGWQCGFRGTGRNVETLSPDSVYAGDETAEALYAVGYRIGCRDRRQVEAERILIRGKE